MSATLAQKSLALLQKRLVRTSRGFYDYNFRQFFAQKAKDDIAAVQKLAVEEQLKFLKHDGPEQLRQMKRMVIVNRMYSQQPVYFDRKADGSLLGDQKRD